jgi:putative peptidoglycan lipid II flippase
MLVSLTLFILIGEFLAPDIVNNFVVPGYSPSDRALTVSLTRIMLLQPLILGLGTIITSILNGKRQFLLPALSIAVYNFGLIGGLLVSLVIPKVGIYGPTFGVLAAAICQVAVQVPAIVKQGIRYSFVWDIKDQGLREVMHLVVPNALTVGVVSIGAFIDTIFASYLPDSASLSAIHNAQLLYAFPIALVSHAVGQALLPHLATQANMGQYVRLRHTAVKVMGISVILTIPAALLLWLLGRPVIHLLFQHGAFTKHSSDLTNLALIGYALGLPGIAAGDLIARGFFALKDTKTPLFTNIFSVAIRFGIIVLSLQILRGSFVILSIPLGTAVSATAEAVLLYLLLFLRLNVEVKNDKGMERLRRRQLLKKRSLHQGKVPDDNNNENKDPHVPKEVKT